MTGTEDLPTLRQTLEVLQQQHAALNAEERMLESKIEKKKGELERNEARLKSLQTVRPAFMEEYTHLEEELAQQYEVYVRRFRNVDYLEQELDRLRVAEHAKQARAERRLRRMQRQVQAEEERRLGRGGKAGGRGGGAGKTGRDVFVKDYDDRSSTTNAKATSSSMGTGRSTARSAVRSQQPPPPPSSSSAQQHSGMQHLHQYPQHAPPLGLGNRKASTASSILEMGAKRSSPSSLGEDTEGEEGGGEEGEEEEEEEEEEEDLSLLPAEEEEEEDEEGGRRGGGEGSQHHQVEDDDF